MLERGAVVRVESEDERVDAGNESSVSLLGVKISNRKKCIGKWYLRMRARRVWQRARSASVRRNGKERVRNVENASTVEVGCEDGREQPSWGLRK